jgi:hypothetical protein
VAIRSAPPADERTLDEGVEVVRKRHVGFVPAIHDVRAASSFGAASQIAIRHFFTVGDFNSRVNVSLSEPEEEGVWQLVVATMTGGQQRVFVPKGGEHASLGLRYDQQA